jgi:hypothetical protein
MDVTPFVETLQRDLQQAADAAGPEGRAAADRMLLALEPAVRLTVLEVLSQAAAEITADLPAGTVEVRLRGREPELRVDVPPPAPPTEPSPPPGATPSEVDEDGSVARVTLRIPEGVKNRAEELAATAGQSLNAWIVAVLRRATTDRAITVDIDLSSLPFGGRDPRERSGGQGGRRVTGWI